MGRAGGGGGSHSHSGGGHSSGRSSGGHSVSRSRSSSSSSRARGSSSYSSRSRSNGPSRGPMGGSGPHMAPPPPRGPHMAPPPPPHYGYGAPPRRRRRSGGLLSSIITLIILFCIIAFVYNKMTNGTRTIFDAFNGGQEITHEREKLDSGVGYRNDCIVDELGWFDNISRTESQLQEFYDSTGVQPYIYLKDYDPALTTEDQKIAWAEAYYDNTFTEENIFLYVYFAEENTDEDVGYMCYVNGQLVSSVMDSEAVEIFWNNIDRYWYTDYSTDDVFVSAFTETASTIMAPIQSKYDAQKTLTKLIIVVVIVIAVIVVLVILFNWWKKKEQREKEEAAETERILNTPLETLVDQNLNDLEDKYK